jgi:hypothetical protein
MADYAISNVPRRVVYAASGVGPYAFTFEILDVTDISVYKASALLTLTTDYTVTINANGTGEVTLVSTAGTSNITIVGAKNIQRTSDFTTGGDLFANTLNDELDNQTIFIQQVAETAERGLKAPVTDPTDIAMTLPAKDGRKGKVLAFDSTTGNPVAGPSLDSLVTVIEQSAYINAVGENIDDVIAVADNESNINTVAGVSSNVTTVATNISNVNTVADDLNEPTSEIHVVGTNITNVNTVGTNIASVNTVAGNNSNVTTVAGISANVTTVAGISSAVSNVSSISSAVTGVNSNSSNINTVAGQITPTNNVSTVAGISANVSTVAGISANVTTVATNNTNVSTVATNIANVNSVGGNIANVNSVAGNATNINAVNANATNINTVAGINANVTTVATNNANVTTVATNIASVNSVAGNASNINQVASDTVAINSASANATTATTKAAEALASANAASASAAAASAVALGNEPVRHSVRPSLLLDFANTKTLDPRITFTRASTGTFYDGKTVAKAEENLLLRSQEFDNVVWNPTGTGPTPTGNAAVAPDGTTTAETVSITSGSAVTQNISGAIAGATYTISVFVKASATGGATNVRITTNNTSAWDTGISQSFALTSSWQRFTLTGVAISSGSTIRLLIGAVTISGGNDSACIGNIDIWGAQLEQRSSVTAYTPTTTQAITNYIPALQTAASGVARFEHNPVTGESLGLEIEEQRTNLQTYSEQFDNAYWTTTQASITANTIVAPDGTITGDLITENTATAEHFSQSSAVTVVNGTTYTASIYVKRTSATRNVRLFVFQSTSPFTTIASVIVNPATGAITNGTGTVQSVGNDWIRISTTGVSPSTGANVRVNLVNGVFANYAGDGYSGIYIWGAQLEAGAFATSYIPTVASQVIRGADNAVMTGTNFSSWYNAGEGTAYTEVIFNSEVAASSGGSSQRLFEFSDNSNSNRWLLYRSETNSNRIHYLMSSGGSLLVNVQIDTNNTTSGTSYKASYAVKTNDLAACLSAGTVATNSTSRMPLGIDRVFIGQALSGGSMNGTIKKLAYYPLRLTNAQLQALTSN